MQAPPFARDSFQKNIAFAFLEFILPIMLFRLGFPFQNFLVLSMISFIPAVEHILFVFHTAFLLFYPV